MTKSGIRIPALSPELAFYLKHSDDAEELKTDKKGRYSAKLGPDFMRAFAKVYDRAYADLRDLILGVAESVSQRSYRFARIKWTDRNLDYDWGVWGPLRKPRGRVQNSQWAGIYLDSSTGTPRIFLVLFKGRKEARRRLIEECQQKWKGDLVNTEDEPNRWPGWEGSPCVVFYEQKLTAGTSLDQVKRNTSKAARDFFRLAIPVLSRLG